MSQYARDRFAAFWLMASAWCVCRSPSQTTCPFADAMSLSLEEQKLQLGACFLKHRTLVRDLGLYESLPRSGAASGTGVLLVAPLLVDMLDHSPRAQWDMKLMKDALVLAAANDGSMNKMGVKNATWAALKAERIITLFYHIRRVKRDDKAWRAMITKLTGEQTAELTAIFAKVTPAPLPFATVAPASWSTPDERLLPGPQPIESETTEPKGEPMVRSPVGIGVKVEPQPEEEEQSEQVQQEEQVPKSSAIDLMAALKMKSEPGHCVSVHARACVFHTHKTSTSTHHCPGICLIRLRMFCSVVFAPARLSCLLSLSRPSCPSIS